MKIRYIVLFVLFCIPAACALTGATATMQTLAQDCAAQAAVITKATAAVAKFTAAERSSITAQIELSRQYCSGSAPSDLTNAAKVVESATVQMTAIVAIASAR
jgi:hypothetical protein